MSDSSKVMLNRERNKVMRLTSDLKILRADYDRQVAENAKLREVVRSIGSIINPLTHEPKSKS